MFDQVVKNGAAAEQDEVRVVEIALPPSTSRSDKQLGRIATLLFILVAGLLTLFGYFASSICITVVLAGFLAILFDPVVVKLPILRRHGNHLWIAPILFSERIRRLAERTGEHKIARLPKHRVVYGQAISVLTAQYPRSSRWYGEGLPR
jgi:uncharacterized membrane protein